MIFILDGPNGAGKSTIMSRLMTEGGLPKDTVWVSFPHRHWSLRSEYHSLGAEVRGFEVFTALYRPQFTYVFDRWSTITSVVYGRIRGQEIPDWLLNPPWLDDVRVIGLFDHPAVLLKRVLKRTCCKSEYTLDTMTRIIAAYHARLDELNPMHVIRVESDQYAKIVEFIRLNLIHESLQAS